MRVLEEVDGAACINSLVHGHVLMHVVLNTLTTPETRHLPLSSLRDSQDGCVRVSMDSRRIDAFVYELVVVHVLKCLGIDRFDCQIQLFEETSDVCVLECLVHLVNRRFDAGLDVVVDGGGMRIVLQGRTVYETSIV